jgi:hypothetical protein
VNAATAARVSYIVPVLLIGWRRTLPLMIVEITNADQAQACAT